MTGVLQQRQHCYARCADPCNFYHGRIVRINEGLRIGKHRAFRVSFGNVHFTLVAEHLA
jgi:hypothetical protein